jgi:hypothetical protein
MTSVYQKTSCHGRTIRRLMMIVERESLANASAGQISSRQWMGMSSCGLFSCCTQLSNSYCSLHSSLDQCQRQGKLQAG